MDVQNLIDIRHKLHKQPEISGQEKHTAEYIASLLKQCHPTQLYQHLAGNGILAVFDSGKPGPTVVFRSELDALPIQEHSTHPYMSRFDGVSHLCGHDGHMTILIGLASFISKSKKQLKGKAALLFQPAEETAQGAKQIVATHEFQNLQPSHIFGLHNLPGYPVGSILVKNGVFAWASIGVKLFFRGESSHAGHPEKGNSPLPAITDLIHQLQHLVDEDKAGEELVTIIHVKLGEEAFGTNPGGGVVMATLRAKTDDQLQILIEKVESIPSKLQQKYHLFIDMKWVEHFPALHNTNHCVELVKQAAQEKNLELVEIDEAFRWTEDFSYYTKETPAGYCGLGSGQNHPPLHASTYDFPDEIIEQGIALFTGVVEQLLYE